MDHAKYTRHLEGEKATLEQEVEELRRRLEDFEQRRVDVEEKLVEGALMDAGHAVSILRSHVPDLDISQISQGYACDRDEARRLFEDSRPTIVPFVEMLDLSIKSDDEEDE